MWTYNYTSTYELYHHGIKGQQWGERNGPPYPLDSSKHSVAEKKAAQSDTTNKDSNQLSKKHGSKFADDKPVWKLDISPEGKQALKKTLIIAGAVAVSGVAAYSIYKYKSNSTQILSGLNYARKHGNVAVSAFGKTYTEPSELYSEIERISGKTLEMENSLTDNDYLNKLPKEQSEAVKKYTSILYGSINRKLRGGASYQLDDFEISRGVPEIIDNCTKALDKSVLKHDIVTYRGVGEAGVSKLFEGVGLDLNNLTAKNASQLVGRSFTDKGFYSSSITKDVVNKFSGSGGIKITTLCPKGTKGMYVKTLSNLPDEKEFLIQRNTKFEILDVQVEAGKLIGMIIQPIEQILD